MKIRKINSTCFVLFSVLSLMLMCQRTSEAQGSFSVGKFEIREYIKGYTADGYIEGTLTVNMTITEPDFSFGETFAMPSYDELSNSSYTNNGPNGYCEFREYSSGTHVFSCYSGVTSFSMQTDFRTKIPKNNFEISWPTRFGTGELPMDYEVSVLYRTPQLTFIDSEKTQDDRILGASNRNPIEQMWVEDGLFQYSNTLKFTVGWSNTNGLRADYQSKIGTYDAAYAHQFWYLSRSSRLEYLTKGTHGYANRFVKSSFEYMETNQPFEGSAFVCPPAWSDGFNTDIICFSIAGSIHAIKELAPGFMTYCFQWSENNENGYTYSQWRSRWISDHQQFLGRNIYPGLVEVGDAGELGSIYIDAVSLYAVRTAMNIRSEAIAICDSRNNRAHEFDVDALRSSPEELFNDLYIDEINENSPLTVTASGDQFFVKPGDVVQMSVIRASDGVDITTDPNTTYSIIDGFAPNVSVDGNGQVTIISPANALSIHTPVVYVVVRNGDDFGMGQFAFTGDDTDGDLILDSVETALGLDPTVSNISSDLDGDGLDDVFEAGFGTNPLGDDGDNDGLNDGEEIAANSDPADPDTDDDGLNDGLEVLTYFTLPRNPDSDGDGLTDGEEINSETTDPLEADTDGDMCADGFEVANGSDPLDDTSVPTAVCTLTIITGVVLEDTDEDDIGDLGLEGVVLNLMNSDGTAALDTNGDPITTTTGVIGLYELSGMSPGDYVVEQVQPQDYASLSEVDGGADGDHPDNGIVNSIPVTVAEGENDAGNDFVERSTVVTAVSVSEIGTRDQMTHSIAFLVTLVFVTASAISIQMMRKRNL